MYDRIKKKVRTHKRRPALCIAERSLSSRKKGGMLMYITYGDFVQTGIFIITLIGLIYEIMKEKK